MESEIEDWVGFTILLPDDVYAKARMADIQALVKKESSAYIWDRDEFNLRFGSNQSIGQVLYGHLNLGDNLDDEWYLVHLLRKISEKYADIVITVEDQDGQFLLIEAANVIPYWLEPDTSENRVFFCKGKLCILPLKECPETPKLQDAAKIIRADPAKYFASKQVQKAIDDRTKQVTSVTKLLHKTNIFVPLKVTAVLKEAPHLLARAVNAFCDQKEDLSSISLRQWEGNMVTTLVTMSKAHFAKLAFQQYSPPKDYVIPEHSEADFVKYDMGLKITAGLSLISSNSSYDKDISDILASFDPSKAESYLVKGQEDNTNWLDIDPSQFDNEMANAQDQFKMNEEEVAELMEQWDKEYDDPSQAKDESKLRSSVEGIRNFLQKMKLNEGPEGDQDEQNSNEDRGSDGEDDGYSDEDDENDADFLEFEILEVLRHDPDLLMRIVELNAHAGIDNTNLMAKLQKLSSSMEKEPVLPSSGSKKGLADIDPCKLEEARQMPYRNLADHLDKQNLERLDEEEDEIVEAKQESGDEEVSEFSSGDEDYGDVAAHTPTLQELFKSFPRKYIAVDDLVDDYSDTSQYKESQELSPKEISTNNVEEFDMQSYTRQMDAELASELSE